MRHMTYCVYVYSFLPGSMGHIASGQIQVNTWCKLIDVKQFKITVLTHMSTHSPYDHVFIQSLPFNSRPHTHTLGKW